MYDFVGPDIHYSCDLKFDDHKDDLLVPCETGEGFFCCRINERSVAILESIRPTEKNLLLHSVNGMIPKELAYVSIKQYKNVAHILVCLLYTSPSPRDPE